MATDKSGKLDSMQKIVQRSHKMTEKDWVENIKELIHSFKLPLNIKVDTLIKLPYAREILEYNLNFEPSDEASMPFETDLLIYEQINDILKPRIVIEAKQQRISTHSAITYSYKAQSHKTVTPFLRYGIMIGNREHYPLPGRLFRHGANFDFMISFQKEKLSKTEKTVFEKLIKKELLYSQQIEEVLLESRSSNRKRYFVMQKELKLIEIENNK
jgi:hypothetical protein